MGFTLMLFKIELSFLFINNYACLLSLPCVLPTQKHHQVFGGDYWSMSDPTKPGECTYQTAPKSPKSQHRWGVKSIFSPSRPQKLPRLLVSCIGYGLKAGTIDYNSKKHDQIGILYTRLGFVVGSVNN
jgi:hypothetical protein